MHSPPLQLEPKHTSPTALTDRAADLARAHGRALADFTDAVRRSPAIASLRPLL